MSDAALAVEELAIAYGRGADEVRVVHDVSFGVAPGAALGIVGESGCGKSQTVLGVLRLLPRGGRIVAGRVRLDGRDLLALDDRDLRAVRGRGIAFIAQDALTALNPAMTIGRQMAEPMIRYGGMSHGAAADRCVELLEMVGIPGARQRLASYPHQLSGGMRQRALIAMAISGHPRVLIADEPTTALDATIQAQILQLLDRLRRELGMALVLITHDLGVVAGVTDAVAVMYAGRIVETAPTTDLFAHPRHPYTRALLHSVVRMDAPLARRLTPIPGLPPDPRRPASGCAFHPRCPLAEARCRAELPPLALQPGARPLRCWVDPWGGGPGR